MRKIILNLLVLFIPFSLFSFLLPSGVYSISCPINIAQNPEIIDTNTKSVTFTITSVVDCFPAGNYSYRINYENEKSGALFSISPVDRRTIIIKRELLGDWLRVGTWHLSVWYGLGEQKRNPNTIIIDDYKFIIQYPGGSPSIRPEKPAYQIDEKAAFMVENAQIGQTYSFWWDGDKGGPRVKEKATATSFSVVPGLVENPGTKKFCMAVGDYASVIGVECKFSATVVFTLGPPPPGTVPGTSGPGFQPTYCDSPANTKIETALGCIPVRDTAGFVGWFLRLAIGIGGGIAFLLMLFGVFQIITSAGDPERLKAGKELITSALIGLLMIIFSLFLLQLIGVEILKIPGFGR